jgi:hypothetical protein
MRPTFLWWGDKLIFALCIAFFALLALVGCATPMNDPSVILADAAGTSAPHPRALLVARVQPSCYWWCNVTLSVNNSEGVKASGTTGTLTTSEAQTTTQTVDQSGVLTPTISNQKENEDGRAND